MGSASHIQGVPQSPRLATGRSARALRARYREITADIRYAIYVRPLGKHLHLVVNFCNEQQYQVAGERTYPAGSVVALGSNAGHPGEFIIGPPPAAMRGSLVYSPVTSSRPSDLAPTYRPCPLPITGKNYMGFDASVSTLAAVPYLDGVPGTVISNSTGGIITTVSAEYEGIYNNGAFMFRAGSSGTTVMVTWVPGAAPTKCRLLGASVLLPYLLPSSNGAYFMYGNAGLYHIGHVEAGSTADWDADLPGTALWTFPDGAAAAIADFHNQLGASGSWSDITIDPEGDGYALVDSTLIPFHGVTTTVNGYTGSMPAYQGHALYVAAETASPGSDCLAAVGVDGEGHLITPSGWDSSISGGYRVHVAPNGDIVILCSSGSSTWLVRLADVDVHTRIDEECECPVLVMGTPSGWLGPPLGIFPID